jgi:ATP-binding protein involved in chromosome partitioning
MTTGPEERLKLALGRHVEPHLQMTLAEAGAIESVAAGPSGLVARIVLGFPVGGYEKALERSFDETLAAAGIEERPRYEISSRIAAFVADPRQRPLPTVANVIAVASGKGGVGKSTVAANLALALAVQGARVGLLDADVYGPSQPRMMGLAGERPTTSDGRTLDPPKGHGIPVMSIGFLVDADQPMAWRGPMPPGTGDIQLTLAQRVPVSGAVIVTTPQEIALLDARKGLQLFRKVGVPVLGIVENMGLHRCPACGHESHIFDEGGGRTLAERYGTTLLGELPLDAAIRARADSGRPTVVSEPDSPAARTYHEIARRAAGALAASAIRGAGKMPEIRIEGE